MHAKIRSGRDRDQVGVPPGRPPAQIDKAVRGQDLPLQQGADASGLLPQALPPPQKHPEAAGIVGGQSSPDLLQAEAELLEVLHPADVADLAVAVIAIAGLGVRTAGDHHVILS